MPMHAGFLTVAPLNFCHTSGWVVYICALEEVNVIVSQVVVGTAVKGNILYYCITWCPIGFRLSCGHTTWCICQEGVVS